MLRDFFLIVILVRCSLLPVPSPGALSSLDSCWNVAHVCAGTRPSARCVPAKDCCQGRCVLGGAPSAAARAAVHGHACAQHARVRRPRLGGADGERLASLGARALCALQAALPLHPLPECSRALGAGHAAGPGGGGAVRCRCRAVFGISSARRRSRRPFAFPAGHVCERQADRAAVVLGALALTGTNLACASFLTTRALQARLATASVVVVVFSFTVTVGLFIKMAVGSSGRRV